MGIRAELLAKGKGTGRKIVRRKEAKRPEHPKPAPKPVPKTMPAPKKPTPKAIPKKPEPKKERFVPKKGSQYFEVRVDGKTMGSFSSQAKAKSFQKQLKAEGKNAKVYGVFA